MATFRKKVQFWGFFGISGIFLVFWAQIRLKYQLWANQKNSSKNVPSDTENAKKIGMNQGWETLEPVK